MPTRATRCPFQNQQGLLFALFKTNSRLVLVAVFTFPRLRAPLHHGSIHPVSLSLFQTTSSSSSPFEDSRFVLAAVVQCSERYIKDFEDPLRLFEDTRFLMHLQSNARSITTLRYSSPFRSLRTHLRRLNHTATLRLRSHTRSSSQFEDHPGLCLTRSTSQFSFIRSICNAVRDTP